MSKQELHDLLAQIKLQRNSVDLVDSEYQQRLDEIIVSLEQQKLYPDTFNEHSSLNQQVQDFILDYEAEHPAIKILLDSIQQILNSFKA